MNSNETIEKFYTTLYEQLDKGVLYRDAIELSAVLVGGEIPAKVNQAMVKFQEAIHPDSHLSKEENRDSLALLSMGVLWDNRYFNPIEPNPKTRLENILAEAVYFIMRYSDGEDVLSKILEANSKSGGEVEVREEMICRILRV